MLKFHRCVLIPSSSSGSSLLQCGWRNLTFQRLRGFGREESEHERGFGRLRMHLRLGKGITVMSYCCNLLMLVRVVLSLDHGSMWKAQFSCLYVFVLRMDIGPLWLNICRLNHYPQSIIIWGCPSRVRATISLSSQKAVVYSTLCMVLLWSKPY